MRWLTTRTDATCAAPAKIRATSVAFLAGSGWGPGQLEGEMARHDWFTTPEDPKLIFDNDRDNLWEDAMARRTRDL